MFTPNSRSYLGRFAQADTIIPEQTQGVQAWDRYAYVSNNPLRYNDPSGHCPICLTAVIGAAVGGMVGAVGYTAYIAATGKEFNSTHFWVATGGAAAAGALIGTGVGFAAGVGVAEATTAAVSAGGAANVACGGDMCASEVQQASQTVQQVLPVADDAVETAQQIVPKLTQGNLKMGLDHIVREHWPSAGLGKASEFGSDISLRTLRDLIGRAAGPVQQWAQEGTTYVRNIDIGRIIGSDPTGTATSWLRVVVNKAGEVITSYPVSGQ